MSKTVYLSPSNQEANRFCKYGYNEYSYWAGFITPMVAKRLEDKGYRVIVAKANETLSTRAINAKNAGADIYVALHSNASANGKARGFNAYTSKYDSRATKNINLASLFVQAFRRENIFTSNSVQYSSTLIDCYKPSMPSVILETGFHDNPDDCDLIINKYKEIVNAIVNAISIYLVGQSNEVANNDEEDNAMKNMLIYLMQTICVVLGYLPSKAYIDGDWGNMSKTAWDKVMTNYKLK